MNRKILFGFLIILLSVSTQAQQPVKGLRLADTLTLQEKNSTSRVILRSELDSLISRYNIINVQTPVKEPVEPAKAELSNAFLFALIGFIVIVTGLLSLMFYQNRRSQRIIVDLNKHVRGFAATLPLPKSRASQNLEKRIGGMHDELEKLQSRNQHLEQPAREYRMLKQEYEMMKQQIADVYKMKNYPGFDASKPASEMLSGLFDTERSVANYAYEKFLKPILVIADSNKNNPAKIDKQECERLLQLLVSLSLLYIEYLYLRIGDLSIGGKMVKRIQGLKNGNGLDPELMKQLNTEHGSRALVLRMVLNAININKLSYPVFDETNLNLS